MVLSRPIFSNFDRFVSCKFNTKHFISRFLYSACSQGDHIVFFLTSELDLGTQKQTTDWIYNKKKPLIK